MKIGTPVSFTRRNGRTAIGKVAGKPWTGDRGEWIPVNTSLVKGKPEITQLRPSQLVKL
jgi:hypothetical protein